jgi:hypothetical protein
MAPVVNVSGNVTSEGMLPLAASIELRYRPGGGLADSTSTDPGDGSYSMAVTVGEYDMKVRADGYVPEIRFVDIQGDAVIDFELATTTGTVLVVSDGAGTGTEMSEDLALIGFEVFEETASSTDPGAWADYGLLVWASGDNTAPVSSSSYRRSLLDFVALGGKLLVEGGELAYDAASSPGYPNFADSVLHTSDWNGDDVGDLDLVSGQTGHPIATRPNALPASLSISYSGWGSQDAAHPTGGGYIVYGTASYPADAGVLVYDGGGSGNSSQVVFFAFAYGALSDRGIARQLLENTVSYLIDDEALVEGGAGLQLKYGLARARPNPFTARTTIQFSLPGCEQVHLGVYDVRGRLVRTLKSGLAEGGLHSACWDGKDSRGRMAASGVYFYRLKTGEFERTRRMTLLR